MYVTRLSVNRLPQGLPAPGRRGAFPLALSCKNAAGNRNRFPVSKALKETLSGWFSVLRTAFLVPSQLLPTPHTKFKMNHQPAIPYPLVVVNLRPQLSDAKVTVSVSLLSPYPPPFRGMSPLSDRKINLCCFQQ